MNQNIETWGYIWLTKILFFKRFILPIINNFSRYHLLWWEWEEIFQNQSSLVYENIIVHAYFKGSGYWLVDAGRVDKQLYAVASEVFIFPIFPSPDPLLCVCMYNNELTTVFFMPSNYFIIRYNAAFDKIPLLLLV